MWAEEKEVLRCCRFVGIGQGGAEVLQVCGTEGRMVLSCWRCVSRGQGGAEVLQVCGQRAGRC